MARTSRKIHDVGGDFLKESRMTATTATGTPAAGTFHSSIVGRADMLDLSQDLGVRFGVDRIMINDRFMIENEKGPNGEEVFGVTNDKFNQIRFVGGEITSSTTGDGSRINMNAQDEYVEVTFYGTGLNILSYNSSAGFRDLRASVDGGAEGSNVYSYGAVPIAGVGYAPNVVVNVATGLALGVHTVKLRQQTNVDILIYGFEVLNEDTTLVVTKGDYYKNGKLIRNLSNQDVAFDSGWTNEYGTSGSRGGHVVVYMDEDGTIKKDIQWTETTQGNLGSADHSNEEVIARHFVREFGMTLANDFNSLTGTLAGDKMYTLADGSTALVGDGVIMNNPYHWGITFDNTVGHSLTIYFVGTGLDIGVTGDTATAYGGNLTISVDGTAIATNVGEQTLFGTTEVNKTYPIVSGLPYGTHSVKIEIAATGGNHVTISDFYIYGPKKPEIEDSSVELASYFLMADFVANSVANIQNSSVGVLMKCPEMETNFGEGTTGTANWTIGTDIAVRGGKNLASDRLNAVIEFTFFGSGFDLRFDAGSNRSSDITVSLNGTTLTAANFATASFSTYGTGVAFNTGTGSLDQNDAGASNGSGFVCSGLPLGLYTIRLNNNVASSYVEVASFDIITPIHVPKINGPHIIQNNLRVGSQALKDQRKFESIKDKKMTVHGKAINASLSTTSVNFLTMDEMQGTIHVEEDCELDVMFFTLVRNSVVGAYLYFYLYMDGRFIHAEEPNPGEAGNSLPYTTHARIPVKAGTHHLQILWKTNTGTISAFSTHRKMIISEV